MATSVPPARGTDQGCIEITGARTHNLRNIDVRIPRHCLVAVTGVSGSGKSSLAFDTLYAEGRRRYLASLSVKSRQFVSRLRRPDVDVIRGLPPTIAIEQRPALASRRGTLGTISEVYDLLRVLYARAGTAHCTRCGAEVSRQSTGRIVEQILELGERRKVLVLAPLVRGQRGGHKAVFERIAQGGLVRARVDGQVVDAGDPPNLAAAASHDIEAVVDRIVLKPSIGGRLGESVDLALEWGDGQCIISYEDDGHWHDRFFSSRFACARCNLSFPHLEPRSFSFHSAFGACPACRGTGVQPDKTGGTWDESQPRPECDVCHGARIGTFAAHVRFAGTTLPELVRNTPGVVREFLQDSADRPADDAEFPLDPAAAVVAAPVVGRLLDRLRGLERLGLDYLTLNRPAQTLSSGETQRARLAAALGARHTGVCFVLDEPTTGLHPRDTGRLVAVLEELREQGNSLIVVEHENELIRRADHVIDIGPGAGQEGGRIVADGSLEVIRGCAQSLTGRFLNEAPQSPRSALLADGGPAIQLSGARLHNLKDVSARFPLGAVTAVTGVSGSGKTSLVGGTLVPALRACLAGRKADVDATATLTGWEPVQRLVVADRARLGRSPRSTPITATGAWSDIRRLFARMREARLRGYSARRFSFNAAQGACPGCRGLGRLTVKSHLLPDVDAPCPRCRGRRYDAPTLEIRLAGRNIADVLELTFSEAAAAFANYDRIARVLGRFVDVGLGYLQLGQPAPTLSGGEAQRVRLASDLSSGGTVPTLYVLDEPSSGLHPADVERLLSLLRGLVEQGHSVVVTEHELRIIRQADWIIDLGPEAGDDGGSVIVAGPPEAVAACAASHTGAALSSSSSR